MLIARKNFLLYTLTANSILEFDFKIEFPSNMNQIESNTDDLISTQRFSKNAIFNDLANNFSIGKTKAALTFPDLATKFFPIITPVLPTTPDSFAPPFVTKTDSSDETDWDAELVPHSRPIIAEWTKTGVNGETIVLTGWQLSNLTDSQFGSDTKFWVYGQTNANNGVLLKAKIQKLDGDIAAITLPNKLPKGSDYMIWAQNSAGISNPVMINQTEAWWIQETATRGQVASIFGRNLSQDSGTQNSNVYLEDANGGGYWAEVVAVNPYKVDFKVPQELANRDYKVWVHNGDGGQYGWSKPLAITVSDGLNYTGTTFNVKDFGAKGDGITDDTKVLSDLARMAQKYPWATIYLPAGTYKVADSIFMGWEKLRWLGDGKDATTIKAADGFAQNYLFQGDGRNQITFQDLTLDANHENAKNLSVVTHIRNSADLQYLNVRIKAEGTSPFDWHGNNRVLMKNSEVIGQTSFLGTAKQVFIDGTKFYGTGYSNVILNGFGLQMLSITNSTAQNLDTSDPNNGKWVKGRFFADQPHWGMSQYQYFGNNQTIDMAPPPADFDHDGDIDIDRNSGEQIMWESEGSASLGKVTTATANTVKFEAPDTVDSNWQLIIVNGKGIGQTRQVKSFNELTKTYEIFGQWNVLPDASSKIVASKIPSKVVVYANTLDGTTEAYHSPTHIASAGVQTYHGAADLIVDNNTFHELRTGVALWTGGEERLMPAYFTQVTNNTFKDNLTGMSSPWLSKQYGTNILGSIIRNNHLDNVNTAFEISMNPNLAYDGNSFPNANMNVYEKNRLREVGDFLSLNQTNNNIHNTIILQNNFL